MRPSVTKQVTTVKGDIIPLSLGRPDLRQHMQLADLSRVDSMIAVRLRATGHSPQEVADAISQCAPTIRDKAQRRDWTRYAERTACYAFGVGGDMVIGRYQQRVCSWQRLETRGVVADRHVWKWTSLEQ